MFWSLKSNNPDIYDLAWLYSFTEKVKYTPHAASLEQYKKCVLFVYDQYQIGHNKNKELKGREYLGTGFTIEKFSMWTKKLGKESYPIPLSIASSLAPLLKVRGQLFEVDPKFIMNLDKERENTVLYKRKRVKIVLPFTSIIKTKMSDVTITTDRQHMLVYAWIYVGISTVWEPQLDGGYIFSPVKHFKYHNQNFGDYYHFTRLDYE